MTESYLKNITPDSLSGLVFAAEGIKNSLVILNGPTGCKFYHSITAENQSLRKDDYDPLNYPEEWFFGQRRVPCTYLDKRDYVYGSENKLEDAVRYILGKLSPEILVIINTPGAALIGDDLTRIADKAVKEAADPSGRPYTDLPVITFQSPGYSRDIIDGHIEAAEAVIDRLTDTGAESAPPSEKHGVNLLGLSIYQKYHAGDIAEISRLLALSGIEVNTAFLCESTVEEIKRLPEALLNIVIDPDWGLETAELLKERFGTPYIVPGCGYPVGFKAAEKLVSEAAETLGTDPAPALDDLGKARAKAYIHIARMSSLTGLPKGAPFEVYGTPALKKGYVSFLSEYLGMTEDPEDPEIVLGDGNVIAMMKAEGKRVSGIEVALPTIGYIDVTDKTHLGSQGGLFLIEQILNSFVY